MTISNWWSQNCTRLCWLNVVSPTVVCLYQAVVHLVRKCCHESFDPKTPVSDTRVRIRDPDDCARMVGIGTTWSCVALTPNLRGVSYVVDTSSIVHSPLTSCPLSLSHLQTADTPYSNPNPNEGIFCGLPRASSTSDLGANYAKLLVALSMRRKWRRRPMPDPSPSPQTAVSLLPPFKPTGFAHLFLSQNPHCVSHPHYQHGYPHDVLTMYAFCMVQMSIYAWNTSLRMLFIQARVLVFFFFFSNEIFFSGGHWYATTFRDQLDGGNLFSKIRTILYVSMFPRKVWPVILVHS